MRRLAVATHPALALMLAASARTGLPHRFGTDLTHHDAAALAGKDAARPFGWILYDSGTHLAWVDASGESYKHKGRTVPYATILRDCFRDGTFDGGRFFLWDRGSLTEFPMTEWHERMIVLAKPEVTREAV